MTKNVRKNDSLYIHVYIIYMYSTCICFLHYTKVIEDKVHHLFPRAVSCSMLPTSN